MKKRLAKLTAITLAASMVAGSVVPGMTCVAAPTNQTSDRETCNAQLSKEAAVEGIVLLENEDNALPLAEKSSAAVFGTGTYGSIKGGTGSGDVYNRYTVTVYDGLKSVYSISNQAWWDNYVKTWEEKKAQAASERTSNDYVIYKRGSFGGADSFLPIDQPLTQEDMDAAKADGTTTAFYTISRVSGEGSDRSIDKGEYYLSDVERANLELMAANFDKTVVLLNVGGIVDTKFYDEIADLDGLVLVSQSGMEGGNAIADILTGKETPSGKLSDTWAVNYEDYPASATIGANDGDTAQEDYTEGIYVGYRYFDSFNVTPAYEFGYGLSYTDFEMTPVSVAADENQVTVTVNVKNVGEVYSGKEVIEVYFSAPDGELEKPYQELAAFAKTDELAPGESQEIQISYNTTEMSSYSEEKAAYIMEDGDYLVRVGNSSRNTQVAAVLTLGEEVVTEQLSNQLEVDREFEELSAAGAEAYSYDAEAAEIELAAKITLDASAFVTENNASAIDEEAVVTYMTAEKAEGYTPTENETVEIVDALPEGSKLIDVYNGTVSMESFVASLTDKQLANIVNGSSGASTEDMEDWGSEANSVAGAAGETTALYGASLGIPNTVEADGPAGIRVTANTTDSEGNAVYNYCTAFPIGTCLAQTWNTELLTRVGEALGEEMAEIGVTLWLAPGMNIHRDPLCGRNFEYYSEDPALTGYVGSCITAGVQSNKGVGVTIKHYISNNQETNRNGVNTSISERAVREIYLKGFEMTVKSAQPMAIMTSYNKVNGVYACENFDLVTSIPRGEWGFDGMVMTDWGAGGRASIDGQMHAGNDLVMPGRTQQRVMDALAGTPSNKLDSNLILGDVQKCAASVLTMIMRSLQFGRMYDSVEVQAHTSTYNDLVSYRAESKEAVQTKAFNDLAAEAEKKAEELENLKSDLAAKDEASAAEKAKLEELEKTLAELQSKLEALENKGGTQEETSEEETFKKQTVTLKKAKSKKKRRATLVWKKVTGADGYVVKLARNKKFKKSTVVEIAKANAKKTTIKKLARKKKYYVCVSAYKVINGKKVYTEYSNVMTVKVK